MLKQITRTAVLALATVFAIITLSFLLVRFMPGNPLEHLVGQEEYYYLLEFNPEELARIADKYAISGTLGEQYVQYLKNIAHLDFGIAYANKQPVLQNVLSSCRWTLLLTVPTFLIGGLAGGALGVLAGWRPGGRFDRVATPALLFLNTVPTNCIGVLFLVAFSFRLRLFPVNGMTSGGLSGMAYAADVLWHAALPLVILILFRISGNFLLMKSTVSQIRNEDYITTAYSKGLPERRVLLRHAVRNAMPPYATSLCMQLGGLLSGSMILEVIFGWKGMGQLFYNAVSKRDFPTAQLCFILSAVCVVGGNLLGDVANLLIDPRVKEGFLEQES